MHTMITCYSIPKLQQFYLENIADYVDGYGRIDREGLLELALQELQVPGDEEMLPPEFELALQQAIAQFQSASL